MKAIELFAGAGGLALGTTFSGFRHVGVLEWDDDACATIRENHGRGVINWPLHQVDVRGVDFTQFGSPDLLAGGPPCQPFSIGGKHRGQADDRNLFPEAIRAIRETRPKAVLIENVKGLLRPAFAKFFEYVLLQIAYPEIAPRPSEQWTQHLSRLEKHHTKGRESTGLSYRVVFRKLNAADYGVPQRRERVFIVGFRNDINANWSFPDPTHSRETLLHQKWVTGEYWDRHAISKRKRPEMTEDDERFARCKKRTRSLFDIAPNLPWLTVRDAISDLPDPTRANEIPNHRHNPGAKAYAGHTGSPLDEPAKTLKAGDHGVPGGENMLAYPDGSVRYFTVRESARLQTFPDNYVFQGSWTESMRQIGNAVAVNVARVVSTSIMETLERAS